VDIIETLVVQVTHKPSPTVSMTNIVNIATQVSVTHSVTEEQYIRRIHFIVLQDYIEIARWEASTKTDVGIS